MVWTSGENGTQNPLFGNVCSGKKYEVEVVTWTEDWTGLPCRGPTHTLADNGGIDGWPTAVSVL